jgi:hypothetical protein
MATTKIRTAAKQVSILGRIFLKKRRKYLGQQFLSVERVQKMSVDK